MLSCSDVAVTLGGRTLFADVDLRLVPSSRVALVGGNGAGKTTLLQVVVGERVPDSGTVSRPRDLRVGWLPQDVVDDASGHPDVISYVLDGAEHLRDLERRLRDLEQQLESASRDEQEQVLETYAGVQDRFRQLGGYELESDAFRTLAGLGFSDDEARRPPAELSGGWRVRAALARLLVARPDLLVLDEPTNHLDLETIQWLEQVVGSLPGALLFVSHDRDFIDATAETIVELAAGTATSYEVRSGTIAAEQGAFASFVHQREERLAQLRATRAQQDRRLAEVERFVERFRYKATKARQVQSRVRALERVERVEVPEHRALVARFQFPEPPRSGRLVAELVDVEAGYGDRTVLRGVDLAIERGRKVALVGPNGAGKSTLLRLLAGELQPRSGQLRTGHNVEVAVVDQHQAEAMDLTRTVIAEFLTALDDRHRALNHRTMLGAFGFPGDLADRVVGELSGGERTRLGLAKVMASPVNLLLLDEPTNHLDLASRDVLEDAIDAYPGTVVLITHDRHVIRSTADFVVEVADGRVESFDGTYEEFVVARTPSSQRVTEEPSMSAAPKRRDGERREHDRERRRLEKRAAALEADLVAAEQRVAELTTQLADPRTYDDDAHARDLVTRHGEAKDHAARLFDQWEQALAALENADADAEPHHEMS